MSERKNIMVSGGRALTGLLITAVAATGAVLAGTLPLPSVERPVHALTVATEQAGEREVVCSGPFAELGADPARPGIAVPVGSANVLIAGEGELATLERSELDETSVTGVGTITGTMDQAMAAAQIQQLSSATLRGIVSSSCVEPVNEQWLVGGGSAKGETTTLNLGNVSDVAATVKISVFDEEGEIDALQTAGVIVAPNSAQVVSLNGYAPNSESLAVRVTSTGAPISASLSITKIDGITPTGAATITRQLRAEQQLVIPGITSEDSSNHDAPADGDAADRFPVQVRVFTPGSSQGTAVVAAIDAEGNRTELGEIELEAETLSGLEVAEWPEKATALVIDADVPVYGAAEATANSTSSQGAYRDFEWFTPAPEVSGETPVPAPIVSGGTLIIANPAAASVTVTVKSMESGTKNDVVVVVPAGSAVPVEATGSVLLSSDAPIHAGVRIVASGALAGYPILPSTEYAGELTVYTQ